MKRRPKPPFNSNWIEILASTPLMRGVDFHVLIDELTPMVRSYQRGETIVHAGDPLEGLGIVADGSVIVQRTSVQGERSLYAELGQGEMFGEMACFLSERRWPATVSAARSSVVVFISPEKIIDADCITPAHRRLVRNMLAFMAQRAMSLSKRMEILSARTLRGKLSAYLAGIAGGGAMVHLPMKRGELADYLNVSRPSLSREFAAMKAEGIIDFYRSSVKILDRSRL